MQIFTTQAILYLKRVFGITDMAVLCLAIIAFYFESWVVRGFILGGWAIFAMGYTIYRTKYHIMRIELIGDTIKMHYNIFIRAEVFQSTKGSLVFTFRNETIFRRRVVLEVSNEGIVVARQYQVDNWIPARFQDVLETLGANNVRVLDLRGKT